MRKSLIALVVIAAVSGGIFYYRSSSTPAQSAGVEGQGGAPGPGSPGRQRPPGGGGPGGGGAFARPPMTVELAAANRAEVSQSLTVVGNLIAEATVAVVPKISGRLQAVYVELGDPVARGGRIAQVEDQELREQVKQAQASFQVAEATVRQREADLNFAQTALERSRNLFGRQLLPRQTLDDAEARHQASAAQLDLARAQHTQAQARLDELRINLGNTLVVSPVNGFVGKRFLDPGAFINSNTPVVSMVDISKVRLVANLVERDLTRVNVGDRANAEVDAFPGETYAGFVARLAPVLDPATRTAEMEIELPNPGGRLKPGMYARVNLTVEQRKDALVVPRNALVDLEGKRGVFVAEGEVARFLPVEVGLQDADRVEITRGLEEGTRVITTGATALRDGDRILLAGAQRRGPGGPGRSSEAPSERSGTAPGERRGAPDGSPGAPPGMRPEAGRPDGGAEPGRQRRLAPGGAPRAQSRAQTSPAQ